MKKIKVAQAAKLAGTSIATVYRRINSCESLKKHLIKEKGCIFLTEEGFDILKKTFQKEETPFENVETEYLKKIIDQQQATIKDLIMRQAEERQRTDTILMKMTNDISNLQKTLEYKKQDESDISSAVTTKQEENRIVEELKSSIMKTDSKFDQISNLIIQQQQEIKEFKVSLKAEHKHWHKKIWDWLNQPLTWRGQEISIEIKDTTKQQKKKETGMRRITEVQAA